jgi:hypothetical protein
MGLRGIVVGGVVIAAAARFDMEATQAEEARLGPRHHLVERGFRGGAILRELGGLRAQKQ